MGLQDYQLVVGLQETFRILCRCSFFTGNLIPKVEVGCMSKVFGSSHFFQVLLEEPIGGIPSFVVDTSFERGGFKELKILVLVRISLHLITSTMSFTSFF